MYIYEVHTISFQTFFVWAFKIWCRLLKIQYVIGIYLMRWLTNFYDFRLQINSYSSNWNTPYYLNFLHISQWITLPTQSCFALYSFCSNLLHSLIMWLIVSSLSPHSLHWLFCCVLCILALIWLVLMALSCAAIRRDSVSLLRFPFLSQVQVFWCEMLLISRLKRPYYYYYYYTPCFFFVFFLD